MNRSIPIGQNQLVYKVHKSVLFGSRISKFIQKSLNALESIVKKLKAFIHMALH